ncbi:MAG TPA: hypothetical protein VM324_01260 [Egibacteraceae bacterium]|nr:hypothetical protein [Egibacteraceae bacterium]
MALTFIGLVLEVLGVVGVLWWAIRGYQRAARALATDPAGFLHERYAHDSLGQRSIAALQDEVDTLKGAIKNEVSAALYEVHKSRVADVRSTLQDQRRSNGAAIVSAGEIVLGGVLQAMASWPW